MINAEEYMASNSDDFGSFLLNSSPSITVPTGTPVLLLYPHNNEHKVTLKAVGHQKEIVIHQALEPSKATEKDEGEENPSPTKSYPNEETGQPKN